MDQWQSTQEMPGFGGQAQPYNGEDWEDWLRWDPTIEVSSPDTSSKESSDSPAQYASSTGDAASWLAGNEAIVTPFVVGEDASMLDAAPFDASLLNFSGDEKTIDPFIFNASASLQPLANTLQADSSTLSSTASEVDTKAVDSVAGVVPSASTSTNPKRRRVSDSTAANSNWVDSQLSPESHGQGASSQSSLSPQPSGPPKKKPGRKRKSEAPPKDGGIGDGEPPVKKTSHNVIEKRYRNNLNDKIVELRDSVPSLRAMSKPSGEEDDSEDLEGLTPAHKLNKSTIMAKATEYIRHLEKRNKDLTDEMTNMKERLSALEKVFARSSSIADSAFATNSPVMGRSRQSSVHLNNFDFNQSPPVLQSDNQLRQRNALQSLPPSAFEVNPDDDGASGKAKIRGNGRGNVMGKLMLGSMAGLMVMEGFSEHNQGDSGSTGKGLVAAPLHLMKRGTLASASSMDILFPALKLLSVLAALVYLALPLFKPKPRSKAKVVPQITLTAPSLSSPVETKRKAWLTAIQSVWTPKPFLVEVVAVGVRMAELSFRRLVGFDRYAELLGMSKEDEAARIKAWDIAIDAQLAGGDAEVSYYRLLLTLMASGTLPDSPIRLMQKAVHFRIFFWEVANAGYGNLFMFKDFTAKVARIYWDSARSQQRALTSGAASKVDENNTPIELLPDHLAALIELECDEVLADDMIQRAYNLAWNQPSAENVPANKTLDEVVEDPAVRSPLDAVAAWFANTVVDEALALSVHSGSAKSVELDYLVNLATKTAPPASSSLARASVAKAVLLDIHREANIAAALESLPQAPISTPLLRGKSTTEHLNVVNHVPVTPEIRTALTLAKLLSLSQSSNPESAQSHAAKALSSIQISSSSFTLLTAIAAHKVLDGFTSNSLVFTKSKDGLEQLAFALRVWVGNHGSGLERAEKGRIVDKCLTITKRAGGWRETDEADSGYGSGLSRRTSDEVEAS